MENGESGDGETLAAMVARAEEVVERSALTQRQKHAVDELAALERKRGQAQQELARLVTQAGCGADADLPEAERRSEDVRELKRKRDELETVLRNTAQGAGIDALVNECKDQSPDDVFAHLSAREAEIQAAERKRKDPEQEIGKLQARLDGMNGSNLAALAAEEAQHAMASIRTHVEDYVRARLASVLLREEINRYRVRNQGPIVSRASELFRDFAVSMMSRTTAARSFSRCSRFLISAPFPQRSTRRSAHAPEDAPRRHPSSLRPRTSPHGPAVRCAAYADPEAVPASESVHAGRAGDLERPAMFSGTDVVSAVPFDAIVLDLSAFWT